MEKLSVSVYRNAEFAGHDCTNNGVSFRHTRITLFWDCTKAEAIKYCDDKGINIDSALILNNRILWDEDHTFAEPLVRPSNMVGPMFGGNFVYTSDGRLYKTAGLRTALPIPVHDRFETQEFYDSMD